MTTPDDGIDQTSHDHERIEALIADTETWVNDVLERVGWDEDHILQGEESATCPVDAAHTVPLSRMQKHLGLCPLLQKGYTKEELEEEQSSKPFYEKSTKVMSIDLSDDTVRGILSRFSPAAGGATVRDLPLTQLRAASALTSEEHLAVYEYCLETVKVANRQASFQEDELQLLEDDEGDGDAEPKSRLEVLAAERDLKRRRQAYRGKNVHTANKSYSEVIGEVITKQVEILTRKCQRQQKVEGRDKRKERSSRHGNDHRDAAKKKRHRKSRSRSRSKERSGSADRDHHRKHKHKKKHKRDRENGDRKSSGVKEERPKVKDERSP